MPVALPQVVFTVPKRQFKRAVVRNRLKRRVREAYRLHKATFFAQFPPGSVPASLAILYIAKEEQPFDFIQKKLTLVLQKIVPRE